MRRRTPRLNRKPWDTSGGVPARARIAVIRAEYNEEITRSLETKCLEGLAEGGVGRDQVDCFTVPGCFEIPLVAAKLAALGCYDVIITLGAVIKGDTLHFELVAQECARGVMNVALEQGVPVIFEVLATRTRQDARRRAGDNRMNKGFEAARAALAMVATMGRLEEEATCRSTSASKRR